jgi:large subunit ribosomal protein LP1
MSTTELATSYAALILADDSVEVTAEKLQSLLKKANVESAPVLTTLFAGAVKGKDVNTGVADIHKSSGTTFNTAAG